MKDSAVNAMVAGGPVNFTVIAKGDLETFQKKDGGSYQKQNVVLEIPATGEKVTVQMFPKFVSYLKEGGMVRCEKGEKYPDWKFVDTSAEAKPKENNFTQVKNERAATEAIADQDKKWHGIAVSKIVHNFMRDCLTTGKTSKDAANIAVDWYFSQDAAVKAILKKEGIDISSADYDDPND